MKNTQLHGSLGDATPARAESRRHVSRMAAEGRGWEALQENLKPMGIDISLGGRPRLTMVYGKRITGTNLSA